MEGKVTAGSFRLGSPPPCTLPFCGSLLEGGGGGRRIRGRVTESIVLKLGRLVLELLSEGCRLQSRIC